MRLSCSLLLFLQLPQAGLSLLRIVGCAYAETDIIVELRRQADRLCSEACLTEHEENELGASFFFAEPNEWKKQWYSMNWMEMGIAKVPHLPCPHKDRTKQAGMGEELLTREDK